MTDAAARELRIVKRLLSLRAEAVAHFLGRARESPSRETLSVLTFHASSLRRYADEAHARLRPYHTRRDPSE